MQSCRSCRRKIIFGARWESGSSYCSIECRDHFFHPGFCNGCLAASTDISGGNMWTAAGSGERFLGRRSLCPACRSVVLTKWSCFLFIPFARLPAYRVKYLAPGQFLSRRLPEATAWQVKLERLLGPNKRLR